MTEMEQEMTIKSNSPDHNETNVFVERLDVPQQTDIIEQFLLSSSAYLGLDYLE